MRASKEGASGKVLNDFSDDDKDLISSSAEDINEMSGNLSNVSNTGVVNFFDEVTNCFSSSRDDLTEGLGNLSDDKK